MCLKLQAPLCVGCKKRPEKQIYNSITSQVSQFCGRANRFDLILACRHWRQSLTSGQHRGNLSACPQFRRLPNFHCQPTLTPQIHLFKAFHVFFEENSDKNRAAPCLSLTATVLLVPPTCVCVFVSGISIDVLNCRYSTLIAFRERGFSFHILTLIGFFTASAAT
jgi:hypothetical protein